MRNDTVFALALLLGAASACGDSTDLPPAMPIEVLVESGDAQTAAAGDTLPEPLVATVLREDGSASFKSIWVELVDGGSVDLGGARASGHAVLQSPTLGTMSLRWVLSDQVGTQRLRFFALELYGDTVEAFATAEATGPPPP